MAYSLGFSTIADRLKPYQDVFRQRQAQLSAEMASHGARPSAEQRAADRRARIQFTEPVPGYLGIDQWAASKGMNQEDAWNINYAGTMYEGLAGGNPWKGNVNTRYPIGQAPGSGSAAQSQSQGLSYANPGSGVTTGSRATTSPTPATGQRSGPTTFVAPQPGNESTYGASSYPTLTLPPTTGPRTGTGSASNSGTPANWGNFAPNPYVPASGGALPGGATATHPLFGTGEHEQTLINLGFGQTPIPFATPIIDTSGVTVENPPLVTAPTATAAQGGFTDFQKLQDALYRSEFDPIQRELTRQADLEDSRLNAQLAQAGLADSGTGLAQRGRQREEYNRQIAQAASDAAQRATAQRYGMEYTQSMENAKLRQQTSLANAGFNMDAQLNNARNLLTANLTRAQLGHEAAIAQAEMQLRTMGLNLQQEQIARQQFLQLLNLQETDLARMDAFELDNLSLFYNTYLRQLAIVGELGGASFGKGDSASSSLGGSVSF
jgi:hypothetical protein